MNINKALKKKNKLAKDINTLWNRIQTGNSHRADSKSVYDVRGALDTLTKDVNELVELKTSIAEANSQVYKKIFRMAELKSMVAHLNLLSTNEDPIPRGYGDNSKEVEYTAEIKQTEKDALVAQYEKEIEEIQEELDKYNFTTEV